MITEKVIYLALTFVLLALLAAGINGEEEIIPKPDTEIATLQLDHVYIFTEKEAPEAKTLQEAGLKLAGDTARHIGQGTASVFFMFENVYLELAWIDNMDELEQADKQFADKLKSVDNGASPFGLGLRRCDPSSDSLPFKTRSYFEKWMKPGASIEIAEVTDINEPEIFVVPPYMGWDSLTAGARNNQPELLAGLGHSAGIRRLTGIRVKGPGLPTESKAISVLIEQGIVEFDESEKHVVELTFDEGSQGKTIDARPVLPLLIHY